MPIYSSKIHFHFLQRNFSLLDRSALKLFIERLFKQERTKLDALSYVFCSDAYLLHINKEWLRHDNYTDIITFGLSDPGQPINAEIYISIDRVRENAGQFDSSFKKELHRVIFHGALHLCGYTDKSQKTAQIMRKMEDKYLTQYCSTWKQFSFK
jgi:probable rRNA maturation factor